MSDLVWHFVPFLFTMEKRKCDIHSYSLLSRISKQVINISGHPNGEVSISVVECNSRQPHGIVW